MFIKLAGWSVIAGAFFAFAIAVTAIPEADRTIVSVALWICFALACIGWANAYFYEGSKATYEKVLNAYLSHNTSDRYPLMILLDSGVLHLKSEKHVTRLMAEIKKERGFDPFHEFEAIPEGRKREALERILNKQIDVGDSEQMIDFLLSFNDIARPGRTKKPMTDSEWKKLGIRGTQIENNAFEDGMKRQIEEAKRKKK